MPDREKVIKGLECCGTKDHCHFGEDGCPYYFPENPDDCTSRIARAALALLKEQAAVIDRYHKADVFLDVHGWRWEDA